MHKASIPVLAPFGSLGELTQSSGIRARETKFPWKRSLGTTRALNASQPAEGSGESHRGLMMATFLKMSKPRCTKQFIGGIDPELWDKGKRNEIPMEEIPGNHSALFAPWRNPH
jgi:hypothetical protein